MPYDLEEGLSKAFGKNKKEKDSDEGESSEACMELANKIGIPEDEYDDFKAVFNQAVKDAVSEGKEEE